MILHIGIDLEFGKITPHLFICIINDAYIPRSSTLQVYLDNILPSFCTYNGGKMFPCSSVFRISNMVLFPLISTGTIMSHYNSYSANLINTAKI